MSEYNIYIYIYIYRLLMNDDIDNIKTYFLHSEAVTYRDMHFGCVQSTS